MVKKSKVRIQSIIRAFYPQIHGIEKALFSQCLQHYLFKIKYLPDVVYIVHEEKNFIKLIKEQFEIVKRDAQVEGFIFSLQKRLTMTYE